MTTDVTWAGPVERATQRLRRASEAASVRKYDEAMVGIYAAISDLEKALVFLGDEKKAAR